MEVSSPLGRITISREAIAQIVGRTAAECYGVVGMAARGPVEKLPWRDKATQGVAVKTEDGGVRIDLHVVVEYGLNLAEVGASVRTRVAYEVERLTQLPIAAVEVHIEDVRQS
ncbi:MAG: Asp23/Gls24 family envelope stress response protein [Gaiellaceae bacterium]